MVDAQRLACAESGYSGRSEPQTAMSASTSLSAFLGLSDGGTRQAFTETGRCNPAAHSARLSAMYDRWKPRQKPRQGKASSDETHAAEKRAPLELAFAHGCDDGRYKQNGAN